MLDLILNILAFLFLTIPYFLAAMGKWKGDSYKFIGFNVIAGILMIIYFTFCFFNPILILLNVIWSVGGSIQMFRKWRRKIE
jgi:hypothetical protein